MSGGVDWREISTPLSTDISPVHGVMFAMYIAFTVIAFMNVVTGVFVEGAISQTKQAKSDRLLKGLTKLFWNLDGTERGLVFADDLKRIGGRELERLKRYGIAPEEMGALFDLMDSQGAGFVDHEEMALGCMRLRGPAKSIDMLRVLHEVRQVFG